MNIRFEFPPLKCATAFFCVALCFSTTSFAQSYRNEATLWPNFYLDIPALKVEDKFYQVSLTHQASSWTVSSAIEISPVDSNYATGSYNNNVLDLKCVRHGGNYYSARLTSTAPNHYSFAQVTYTKLADCPLPPGLGPTRGQWIRTADSPLGSRNYAGIAWTGNEIVVFGGLEYFCPAIASCVAPTTPPYRDGAAYNPLTNSWRKIADAPGGIVTATATVGSDIYVLGLKSFTSPPILMRYRSTEDTWEELGLPVNPVGMSITAFGNNIVLYSGEDRTGTTPDYVRDTATGKWTQIPISPLGPGFGRGYVAFGDDLYLFDHKLTSSPGGADGPSYLRAARLRAGQWKVLPIADSIGHAPTLIAGRRLIAPELGCADGGRINVYGRCIPFGAVFDIDTETWSELPNAPGRGVKYIQSSGGIGDSKLVLRAAGLPALDATTNTWFLAPVLDADPNTQRSMAATGPYGFAFGGATARGVLLNDAWIWKP